ncbi:DUF2631 domain-containing protein [Nakamurella leprariae]|uniref:DUF2631 domain-containing protein n=1 Tax=Nakamurella leprariae TaxID=2803911 RepID=A0A938YA15_9ACTN|nr:DUF2631 domain-containing protein [Nakamurella leprariae]MBM9465823.1 DUF2631 domain-containing protein [Nakamurella leprariae]
MANTVEQPTGGEEGAATHVAGSTLEIPEHPAVRYNPDAPSQDWGWHGSWREFAPRGSNILLVSGVVVLILMFFIGNHVSNVENYWLWAIAALMVVWIAFRTRALKRKQSRRP